MNLRIKHIHPQPRTLTYATIGVFGVLVFALLANCYGLYMLKIESLSLFLGTRMYFDECMSLPGGTVMWLSSWLTQYLHYAWLGALVVALLAMLVQWLAIKAFRIPWRLAPLTVILPVLTVSAFINLGYLIFTLRPAGHALALPVGLSIALVLFWIYRTIRPIWARVCFMALTVVLGYWPLGFYALLAGCMCAVYHLLYRADGPWRFTVPAVGAVLIVLVPYLWFLYIGGNLMASQIYLSGLPYFYTDEWGWWTLYGAIFAVMVGFALFTDVHLAFPSKPVSICTAWALMVALMLLFRYNDRDFNLTLNLDHALWQQDWDGAVALAKSHQGPTTRLNTVLGYVAAIRSHQAPDMMFTLPCGDVPYNTSRDTRPMHDAAGALIAYHLGLVNYAYRWGMEYTIAQSPGVERLKILTKCALLNNEMPLARTYLEILYNTPFHREWARRYMRYVNHPMEISSDPELAAVRRLMCQQSRFVNDGGAYEAYIWPLLAQSPEGTPDFMDLSMLAALVVRDLDTFVDKVAQRGVANGRHYQEAVLLWSVMTRQAAPVAIDPAVSQRHRLFLDAFRATSALGAERQREAMRADFGDTYWFYYIFTEDMQMI